MAGPRHISVSETSRPVLPRHAKLKYDEMRKVWVILAPERVLAPDEIAVEVLQLCDGERNVGEMADQLAAKYAAPREAILADVIVMLQDLADKGFLTGAREKTSGAMCSAIPPSRPTPATASRCWRRAARRQRRSAFRSPCCSRSPIAARCNVPIAPTRSSSTARARS